MPKKRGGVEVLHRPGLSLLAPGLAFFSHRQRCRTDSEFDDLSMLQLHMADNAMGHIGRFKGSDFLLR